MKHVSILVPNEAVMASIVDPRTVLTGANDFLGASGREPAFKIQMVGLAKEVELNNGLFAVRTDAVRNAAPSPHIWAVDEFKGNCVKGVPDLLFAHDLVYIPG